MQKSEKTWLQTAAKLGKRSLLNLLLIAKIPLGHTMYVWGGGWNEEDIGAGVEAVSIGESPLSVLLCGTGRPDGSRSQAIKLAESYMSYYPDCTRNASYLADSSQMRWSFKVLSDEEGIQNMGTKEVLKRIFDTS